jgi:hypothetical protein
MLWVIIVVTSPFLVWLWLGVAFTIVDFALYWANKESNMTVDTNEERARIIRYTRLDEPNMPGLLSFFEEEKNILHIDRDLAADLPDMDRHRLEMTHVIFTRKASAHETGLRFKPYLTQEVTIAAQ